MLTFFVIFSVPKCVMYNCGYLILKGFFGVFGSNVKIYVKTNANIKVFESCNMALF
jgi:hypothetical protein